MQVNTCMSIRSRSRLAVLDEAIRTLTSIAGWPALSRMTGGLRSGCSALGAKNGARLHDFAGTIPGSQSDGMGPQMPSTSTISPSATFWRMTTARWYSGE